MLHEIAITPYSLQSYENDERIRRSTHALYYLAIGYAAVITADTCGVGSSTGSVAVP